MPSLSLCSLEFRPPSCLRWPADDPFLTRTYCSAVQLKGCRVHKKVSGALQDIKKEQLNESHLLCAQPEISLVSFVHANVNHSTRWPQMEACRDWTARQISRPTRDHLKVTSLRGPEDRSQNFQDARRLALHASASIPESPISEKLCSRSSKLTMDWGVTE